MSAKYDSLKQSYRARSKNDHEDFFPTYHALTRAILPYIECCNIVEPCAGAGDIVKVLQEDGRKVILLASDIAPRAPGIVKSDYLSDISPSTSVYGNTVVTNPPFKLSIEFFERTNELGAVEAWFLWPLDYLHGYARRDRIFGLHKEGNLKLKTCYPFVRRPLFDWKYSPEGKMPTGATSFAWFHFIRSWSAEPTIKWLNVTDFGKPTLQPKVKEFLQGIKKDLERKGLEDYTKFSKIIGAIGKKMTKARLEAISNGESLPTKREADLLRQVLMTTKDYALERSIL